MTEPDWIDAERDMAADVERNKELYEEMAGNSSTQQSDEDGEQSTQFDAEAFLEWLDEYDGHVYKEDMIDEWPNFPWDGLTGQTCPFRDGELAYYQHDLRQIAEGRLNFD